MYRKLQFKFKVLRNNVEYAELFAKGNPVLCMNRSSGIKTSLRGTFAKEAINARGQLVEVDWLSDEIQPVLIIDDIEKPLAVVMPASVIPTTSDTGEQIEVEAYDRCWRVSDTKTEQILHVDIGTNYINAIESLLIGAGVTLIIKTGTSEIIAEDREWEIGTSYLDIVNQLLSEINYEGLFFNESGIAVLKPINVTTADNVAITFTDKEVDPRDPKSAYIKNVFPEYKQINDIYKSPNVFVCVCSNPDKSDVMIAKAENTNPQSPLSVQRRGRRIVSVINVDNIASQTELQSYANNIRNESMITGEVFTIKTLLLPGIRTSDIVGLQIGDVGSICIEEQWEMELGIGGLMTHQVKRMVINIG